MSQPPKNKPPMRQVPTRNSGGSGSGSKTGSSGRSGTNYDADIDSDYEAGPSSRSGGSNRGNTGGSSRSSGSGRSGGRGSYGGNYGPPPPRDYRNVRPRNVQPQRDPFPYIMGGIIGALVVGLMLVIFLLINNNKNNTALNPIPVDTSVASGASTAASDDPPRISMADFKTLYDDPSKRPLILDVRTIDTYNAGHITGAESFPESDVATRVNELPKDKLIVAYCQ